MTKRFKHKVVRLILRENKWVVLQFGLLGFGSLIDRVLVEVSPLFNAKICKKSGECGNFCKISGECGEIT